MTTAAVPAHPTLEGELGDFVLAEYKANPQFVDDLFAKGETAVKTFLVGVISNIHVNGLAGILLPAIEGGAERFVDQLIAKYPPDALRTIVGEFLQKQVTQLGG